MYALITHHESALLSSPLLVGPGNEDIKRPNFDVQTLSMTSSQDFEDSI